MVRDDVDDVGYLCMDNFTYNENVMRWCGSIADIYTEDDGYDILIDEGDEIIVYDDSGEWYNIDDII